MRIALLLAGVLLAAGCRAPLEGAPCPCLSGYECSAQDVCVLVSNGGPEADASGDDGDGDGDGDTDAADGFPDASGGAPDAGVPDGGGGAPDSGEPDGGSEPDAGAVAWYEQ